MSDKFPKQNSGLNRFFATAIVGLFISFSASVGSTQVVINNPPPSATGDFIELLDGSKLHGRLQAINSKEVLWHHPEAKAPILFQPSNIESIRLEKSKTALPTTPACRFQFKNGDELFGELSSLQPNDFVFETWFGKNLKGSRESLEAITFLSRESIIYEGPESLQGWTQQARENPVWQYRDGAFIATGQGVIGRDFKLPPASRVEFDLTWSGQFSLMIPFYSEIIDRFDYSASSYMFYINTSSLGVQRVQPGVSVTGLGPSVQMTNQANPKKLHLEIRARKEDASLAWFVNGELVQKWKDEKGFVAKGSGLLFFAQIEGGPLTISNLKISEWDGKFDEEKISPDKEDWAYLTNHDKVSGQLKELRDGKLNFLVNEKVLQIPLARVGQIVFASSATNAPGKNPKEIRTLFSGGGRLSLQVEKWEEQTVSGLTSFGQVTFETKAIREIQFNPSPTKPEKAVDDWDEIDTTPAKSPGLSIADNALYFRDGDFLHGSLRSIESGNVLRWERGDAPQPIEFNSGAIAEIRFRPPSFPRHRSTNASQVYLHNADQIEGNLVGLDAEKIILETSYAGRLNFPRDKIAWIAPVPTNPPPIFEGPTGLAGWTMGKIVAQPNGGEWEYKNGAFYATKSASIARPLQLPDRAIIQFDFAWKGMLKTAIALYSDSLQPVNLQTKDTEPDFGGFYSMQIDSFSALIMRVKKTDPLTYLAQGPLPGLNQKSSAHFEVRVDKPRRLIALFIDGQMVKQWIDSEPFAGSGTGMRFVHQGLGSLRLSGIRILPWDGVFEEPLTAHPSTEFDTARLRNGDKISGHLESISDGKLVIQSQKTKLDIPFHRVKQIEFVQKNETPNDSSANILGFFGNQQGLKFHLEKWNENGVEATSQNFGKATFNPAAFERIRFIGPVESSPKK